MSLMLHEDHDLAHANTLGLPCRAAHFVAPRSVEALGEALGLARSHHWPLTLLGGGSNLILPASLSGLVLQPAMSDWWLESGEDEVWVHAEACVNWHELVMALARLGLWGTENLALIPGHCGAAPIQNIGAYGVELSELLHAVHVMYLDDGREAVLGAAECDFGYRDSIFKGVLDGRVVITRLVLRLSRRPRPRLDYGDLAGRLGTQFPTPLAVAEAVSGIRREKLPDPAVLGNAGSFFKNPVVDAEWAEILLTDHPEMPHFVQRDGRVKLAAGWLIERCGLKGWRQGHFAVHDRQALVVVHLGGGGAEELLAFADRVAGRVAERFGIALEREPRLAGEAPRGL